MDCYRKGCKAQVVERGRLYKKFQGIYRGIAIYRCPKCGTEWQQAEGAMTRQEAKERNEAAKKKAQEFFDRFRKPEKDLVTAYTMYQKGISSVIGHYVKFIDMGHGVQRMIIVPVWLNFIGFILVLFGYKKIKEGKLPRFTFKKQ